MKKTLVALAALAATASFAQSSVGIVGVFDIGYKATSATTTTGNTSKSLSRVDQNGVSTSAIKFVGTEDIGGGLKATFLAEINPNLVQSSTSNQNYAFASDFNGTPFNGEQYVGLNGGFGDVKLGVPNAGFFLAENESHPFGTALGSFYAAGGGYGRLGTAAQGIVSGVNSGSARIIRHERAVQYTTPSFNGLTVTVGYAAQNDNSTSASANQDGYQDVSVMYKNGPLSIAYSNAVNKFGNGSIPSLSNNPYTTTATPLSGVANGDYTYNVLAGNYNFGATTVYAGYTTTKSNGAVTAIEDATSYNVAAKYVMGQIDLLGNYTVRTSNLTNVANARMIGLGANYNLSKRTSVYYRFESLDTDTNIGSTAGGSVTNVNMVGLRHAF